MIALDDFRFAMAIHTGQYASFDTISFIICLLNRLNGDNGALFLPKAGRAFLIGRHSTMFFGYQSHNSQKSYQGKDVNCLCTAESHLKRNTLLLQLSCYQTRFKSISRK